jgi:hypothetical protein
MAPEIEPAVPRKSRRPAFSLGPYELSGQTRVNGDPSDGRAGNWDIRGTYSEDGDLHSEFFATLIKPGIAELYYWRSHAGGTYLRMHPVLRCGLPGLRGYSHEKR